MQIISLLAGRQQGFRLAELADRLSLPPQTVQSLLRTLQGWQMVSQVRWGGPYLLGPMVTQLSRQWIGIDGHATLAQPVIETANEEIGEYVLLAELRGGELHRLVECESSHTLRVRPSTDHAGPIHTMATGKILLAHLPDSRRKQQISRIRFEPLGPNAAMSAEEFDAILRKVRQQGYAVSIDETATHVSALAVPVHGADGEVVAALGTYLPTIRFSEERRKTLLEALKRAAREIEDVWGAAENPPLL